MIQRITQLFLKPPYSNRSYSLGPAITNHAGKIIIRKDYEIEGIPISHYYTASSNPARPTNTAYVYCHSYNSNRSEALSLVVPMVQNQGRSLITFDFQRVHPKTKQINNEDGHITFGYYETEQLRTVLKWVEENVSKSVILWGRSMGAFTALNYYLKIEAQRKRRVFAANESHIAALILDSPYHSVSELVSRIIHDNVGLLPLFLIKGGMHIAKSEISKLINFDIDSLELLPLLKEQRIATTPLVLITSQQDLITGEATKRIYQEYTGPKQFLRCRKLHDEQRDLPFIENVLKSLNILLDRSSEANKKVVLKSIANVPGSNHANFSRREPVKLRNMVFFPRQVCTPPINSLVDTFNKAKLQQNWHVTNKEAINRQKQLSKGPNCRSFMRLGPYPQSSRAATSTHSTHNTFQHPLGGPYSTTSANSAFISNTPVNCFAVQKQNNLSCYNPNLTVPINRLHLDQHRNSKLLSHLS